MYDELRKLAAPLPDAAASGRTPHATRQFAIAGPLILCPQGVRRPDGIWVTRRWPSSGPSKSLSMTEYETSRSPVHTRADPLINPEPTSASDTAAPRVALLSNGRYGVVVTAAGSGCGTWRGLDVTRWREDSTRDCWGQFCYIRDPIEGRVWSAGYQPL